MKPEPKHQAAPCATQAETGHMVVAVPTRMHTITIDDKSGANLPAISIRLRWLPELVEARAGVIQPSFIPKNGTV